MTRCEQKAGCMQVAALLHMPVQLYLAALLQVAPIMYGFISWSFWVDS